MPGTVNEFPAFTAILGDFHSHHMALPWLIGWLALIVGARRWSRPAGVTAAAWVAMGAGAALANMWNLPLMAWAIGLGAACFAWERWRGPTQANTQRQQNPGRPETEGQRSDDDSVCDTPLAAWVALGAVAGFGIVIGIGMAMMRGGQGLPLSTSGGGGWLARIPLRIVPDAIRSTLAQLMEFWGLPVIALGLAAAGRAITQRRWLVTLFIVSVVPCAMALHSGPLLWFAVLVWAVILSLPPVRSVLSPEASVLLFGVLAVSIGLEVFYIDDFYSGQYERYNTYFKFSYPLWPALIVAAAAAARTLWNASLVGVRWGGRACLAAIALAAAVYPIFAFSGAQHPGARIRCGPDAADARRGRFSQVSALAL